MFGMYLPVLSVGEGVAVVMVDVDVAPITVDDNIMDLLQIWTQQVYMF